jgi:hypothetical protein
MDIHNEFIACKYDLVFYAGKPVLNRRHAYYDINGDAWDFSLAIGYTFTVWEEREGGLEVISWTDTAGNLALSGSHPNEIILNAQATDTAIERGKYYYEAEYIVAGGYPILLNYGEAKFI